MRNDEFVANVENEDDTVIIYIRKKTNSIMYSGRYEAFAEMTPGEAKDLVDDLQSAIRQAETITAEATP